MDLESHSSTYGKNLTFKDISKPDHKLAEERSNLLSITLVHIQTHLCISEDADICIMETRSKPGDSINHVTFQE